MSSKTIQSGNVLINGNIHIYRDKGPYVKAGKSVMGAIEYDEKNDALKCHVCGEWKQNLAGHLVSHDITARAYKLKFGLRRRTALIGERTRAKISLAASKRNFAATRNKPEFRAKQLAAVKNNKFSQHERATQEMLNSRMHCKAQLLQKFRSVAAAVGHTPSKLELKEHGMSWQSLVHHFGSLSETARIAKLAPNPKHQLTGTHLRYSTEQIMELLRNFEYRVGRFPTASDMNRHMFGLPSQSTFIDRFGSLAKARKRFEREKDKAA